MNYTRRTFVKAAGTFAAGSLILPQWACSNESGKAASTATEAEATSASIANPSIPDFGLQLYTLRDDLPKDPKGILKQVASFGYQQIEGYEGDLGLFWGMKNTEFKAYLDEIGLNMVSTHCEIKENFETKAAQAAEIGIKYLICPYIGPQKTVDDWKKVVDDFNTCGEICKTNGIRFAYHNHGYSFEALDGVMPQDYMMDNTDPETVDFELDIYWVITGNADPVAYFNKYPNRFRLCHIKDRLKDAAPGEADASCDVGTGSIDFPDILKVAADNGMQYFIIEQERYDNSTPLKSAKAGADYMKNFQFAS